MMRYTREIKVGKGSIKISESAEKIMECKIVIIRGESVNGPCTDSDCQIMIRQVVEIGNTCPNDFVKISDDKITLCMQREIARSIDVGRQLGVRIEATGNSLFLKNFVYVS